MILVLLCLAVLFMLFCAFSFSPEFALQFDSFLGAPLRIIISRFSSYIPFSLTEAVLFLLPALAILFSVLAVRSRRPCRFLSLIAAVFVPFLALYTITFVSGHYKPPLEERLGVEAVSPTAEELLGCCSWLSSLAASSHSIPCEEESMRALRAAFERVGEHYGIPVNTAAVPKKTGTSLFSSLGFFGLYAFPFGEVTVTAECPPTVRVFTAAHEMAHASGLLREEEADAFGFLACLESGDPYLISAGATGMLGRLLTELEGSDYTAWVTASEVLPDSARRDLVAAGDVIAEDSAPALASAKTPYGASVRLLYAIYRSRR